MKKFPICSIKDGNTLFYVEAVDDTEAAFKALEELGYFMAEPDKESDEEGDEENDEEDDS